MGDSTNIEWADATVNLWIGCTKVSAACDHCYAEKLAKRFKIKWDAPPIRTKQASWGKIRAYQRAAKRFFAKNGRNRRVFVNSLSDFCDNQAEQSWRDEACIEFEAAPDVIIMLVTKRPQNVRKMVPAHWLRGYWPANVWVITTTENQEEYDRRVPHLLTIPGPKVVGLSMEPLLGAINPGKSLSRSAVERASWCAEQLKRPIGRGDVNSVGWAIIGGESGRQARPMPPLAGVADMAMAFSSSGAAVFVKQMSAADFPASFKDYASFPARLKERTHPK